MKNLLIYPLLSGLLLISPATQVYAQTDTPAAMPLTREQVKRERDEFIRTHRYDQATENWVLKEGMEPPKSMKTRAEVKAERDEFLRNHHFDQARDMWVPNEKPRDMSTLTREQVREETRQFIRTHHWDDNKSSWVEQPEYKKKK
jgi:hypothetical protein